MKKILFIQAQKIKKKEKIQELIDLLNWILNKDLR